MPARTGPAAESRPCSTPIRRSRASTGAARFPQLTSPGESDPPVNRPGTPGLPVEKRRAGRFLRGLSKAPRSAGPAGTAGGPSTGFLVFLGVCSAWAAAAALLPRAPYGVSLTPGAVRYISIARSLLAGEGFTAYDGAPEALRPPLFPLVLAAAGRLVGQDPLHLAGPLNAAFFALSVFLVGRFLADRLESRFLRFCAPAAAALSLPLAHWASFAKTESLFALLALLALLQTERYLAGGGKGRLAGAAVFGALAWQTRYIGAAVPAAVVLALLFAPGAAGGPRPRVRARIRAAALCSLAAAAPMGLWLWRNFLVLGASLGQRLLSGVEFPAGELVRGIAVGLARWTWIEAGLVPGFALWACAFAVPSSAFLLRAVFSRSSGRKSAAETPVERVPGETPNGRPALPARPDPAAGGRVAAVFGGFSAAYLALLVLALAAGNTRIGLEPRFLVPAYLPLLACGAVLLDYLYRRERGRRRRFSHRPFLRRLAGSPRPTGPTGPTGPTLVSMAALGLWTLAQVPPGARAAAGGEGPGPGPPYIRPDATNYASDRWTNSPTARFLRTDPLRAPAGPIWSNRPGFVYLLETRGRTPILRLPPHRPGLHGPPPHPEGTGSPGSRDRRRPIPRDAARRWLRSQPEGVPVVWFHSPLVGLGMDFGPPALRVTPGVEPLAEFEDGAVFVVNPGYSPATNRYDAALDRIRSGAAGPPAARSAFDLYLEGRTLLYLREPCSPEDEAVRGLFFVETAPPDASGAVARFLFPFVERGVFLAPAAAGGSEESEDPGATVCVLVVPLEAGAGPPARAGGRARDGGEIWAVEFPAPEAAAR